MGALFAYGAVGDAFAALDDTVGAEGVGAEFAYFGSSLLGGGGAFGISALCGGGCSGLGDGHVWIADGHLEFGMES